MSPTPATVLSSSSLEALLAPGGCGAETQKRENPLRPSLRPIEGILIVIDDDELEGLAKLFELSRVRQAMTFEAYLAMKGFARSIPKAAHSR